MTVANEMSMAPRAGFGASVSLVLEGSGIGCTAVVDETYHGTAVASACRKSRSRFETLTRAPVAGCVPSLLWKSEHCHVSPSPGRGSSPSAHRYGPQASHGAPTAPWPAS